MEHLSEETLAALFERTFAEDERRAVDAHLDSCTSCRRLAALLARNVVTHSGTAATGSPAQPPLPAPSEPPQGPGRYRVEALLGLGGMGEVIEVVDPLLRRPLALKRVRPSLRSSATTQLLWREAQITSQLEHPNIVPVHDVGRTEDGEPFFVMRRLSGRTLKHLLDELQQASSGRASSEGNRMAILFLQVVGAVSYAHLRGVVHGDLKPGNILLGPQDEVMVTDWGLARTGPVPAHSPLTPVTLDEIDASILPEGGTAYFLSPEQAEGAPATRASDIYALGALLYAMLTLRAPFEGRTLRDTLAQIRAGNPVPPRLRAPDRAIAETLEHICLRAMAKKPEDRYPTAEALREAVEAFLTGAQKRALAQARFEEGEQAAGRLQSLRQQWAEMDAQRASLASVIPPHASEDEKRPLWTVEEQLTALGHARDEALADALDRYAQAVGIDADFAPAAERLADLHLELFLEAEAQGDARAQLLHRRNVERFHQGRHSSFLSAGGTLSLQLPREVRITRAVRLAEVGKRILPVETLSSHASDWHQAKLPRGSYLFHLEAPGHRSCAVHVFVSRGMELTLSPRLFREDEIAPDFVHVPAGPFIFGGDRIALNSSPRQQLWLPDFFIARHPVTCAEYLEFLNALRPDEATRHVPRTRSEGGLLWERNPEGAFFLPEVDGDGNPCHPQAPVMGVSFEDAEAFAAWRSRRDGRVYRLPTEQEWEKATRGADGRFFPWGNLFDSAFCKMAQSRPGRPQPEPVGAFPGDTSVYGMQDCAGAIREWCASYFDEARTTRVLRGGAWYFNPNYCRLAFRHGYYPYIVFTNFGMRLCQSAPE